MCAIIGKAERMEDLTTKEFDLLDELYFVQHYDVLKEAIGWKDSEIQQILADLLAKDFIKLLVDHDIEFRLGSNEQQVPWKKLYYLASKKGLMIHNGF